LSPLRQRNPSVRIRSPCACISEPRRLPYRGRRRSDGSDLVGFGLSKALVMAVVDEQWCLRRNSAIGFMVIACLSRNQLRKRFANSTWPIPVWRLHRPFHERSQTRNVVSVKPPLAPTKRPKRSSSTLQLADNKRVDAGYAPFLENFKSPTPQRVEGMRDHGPSHRRLGHKCGLL
jgi:hypothetical protein